MNLETSSGQDAPNIEIRVDKSYKDRTTVNGVEIEVGWDEGYDNYVITFPQMPEIQAGDEASKAGVYEKVVRLGVGPDGAKKIYEEAAKIALTESDLIKIYKKVENFSHDFHRQHASVM